MFLVCWNAALLFGRLEKGHLFRYQIVFVAIFFFNVTPLFFFSPPLCFLTSFSFKNVRAIGRFGQLAGSPPLLFFYPYNLLVA